MFAVLDEESICVGLARVGSDTEKILSGTLKELTAVDFGPPLHSLVIPGYMHPLEMEMLRSFAINKDVINQLLHNRFQDQPWLQELDNKQ